MFLNKNLSIVLLVGIATGINTDDSTENTNEAGITTEPPTVASTADPFTQFHPQNVMLEDAYYTYLNITWIPPLQTVQYYVVYYTTGLAADCPLVDHIGRDVDNTSVHWTIKGLQPATTYSVCVEANYGNGSVYYSQSQHFNTTGHGGPANPCDCKMSAVDPAKPCDPETGVCNCKDKTIAGDRCDQCADKYYYAPKFDLCEPCRCDISRSNQSCYVDTGIVMCHCNNNYKGLKCESCKDGFFVRATKCLPCHCSNNQHPNNTRICRPDTGHCLECGYNTTGDHCDRCLDGYVGSAPNRTCVLDTSHHTRRRTAPAPAPIGTGGIVAICLLVGVVLVSGAALSIYCATQRCNGGRKPSLWSVRLRGDEDVNFSQMMEGQDLDDSYPSVRQQQQEKTQQRLHLNINGSDQVYRSIST